MKCMSGFFTRILLAGGVAFGLSAGQAVAAVEYWVVDVAGTNSEATGLNDRSQVVGWAKDANGRTQAFLWEHGTLTGLGFLTNRWSNSVALAINNQGEITGYSSITFTNAHAFRYATNHMTDLGTLGGPNSWGRAINANGDIAGSSQLVTNVPNATHPESFRWRTNQFIHVPPYVDRESCDAYGIDSAGRICGVTFLWATDGRYWAYVWEDLNTNGVCDADEMEVLGSLGTAYTTGSGSAALAMNDCGQVVGWTSITNAWFPRHAFLVTRSNGLWRIPDLEPDPTNSLMLDLGTLDGPDRNSYANAINNQAWIVGTSAMASGTNQAFLWREGVMINLNDLIPPDSGWVLTNATAINEHGEIVGSGRYLDQSRAFLLQNNGRITHFDPALQTNTWIYTNELEEVVTQSTVTITGQVVQWAGIWDGNPYTSHVFTVEYCDTLRPPADWTPVAPTSQWPVLENIWTDTNYPAVSTRFFRVRAELPP